MSADPVQRAADDPEPSLVEELQATTHLTRTVPLMVREVCAAAADHIETVESERDALAAIVRDLAGSKPIVRSHGTNYCAICDDDWVYHSVPECPHRRACEWVARQEAE